VHQKLLNQVAQTVRNFKLPRYQELPGMGLYLEQVIRFINDSFAPIADEMVTASMVSNYVKRGMVEKPIKKLYSRAQVAHLMFIATVKTVLNMEDIKLMISIQRRTYEPQVAYDYFCSELENILQYVFGCKESLDQVGQENTSEKIMLRNTVVAAAHKLYLSHLLSAIRQAEEQA